MIFSKKYLIDMIRCEQPHLNYPEKIVSLPPRFSGNRQKAIGNRQQGFHVLVIIRVKPNAEIYSLKAL